jgi:hypothetical protein
LKAESEAHRKPIPTEQKKDLRQSVGIDPLAQSSYFYYNNIFVQFLIPPWHSTRSLTLTPDAHTYCMKIPFSPNKPRIEKGTKKGAKKVEKKRFTNIE